MPSTWAYDGMNGTGGGGGIGATVAAYSDDSGRSKVVAAVAAGQDLRTYRPPNTLTNTLEKHPSATPLRDVEKSRRAGMGMGIGVDMGLAAVGSVGSVGCVRYLPSLGQCT